MRELPPIRGLSATSREISGNGGLGGGGRSPDQTGLRSGNSLLAGKLTGNFATFGALRELRRLSLRANPIAYRAIPYGTLAGIFFSLAHWCPVKSRTNSIDC